MRRASRPQRVDKAVDAVSESVKEDVDVDNGIRDEPREILGGVRAADLLNQQIWCWGQDINHAGGNLLVRHGFQRIEKPPGSKTSSSYRMDVSPTARVVLRGFGVFYGDDRWGGLFLRRYEFSPLLTPAADLPAPVWTAEDLPELTEPHTDDVARSDRLLVELVDWIRRYEVWIAEGVGLEHRRRALMTWNPKQQVKTPVEEMAAAWRSIGLALDDVCVRVAEPRDAA